MNLLLLDPDVQKLARLGDTGVYDDQPWVDYTTMGILPRHIPDLMQILTDIEDYNISPETDPITWTPLHAWRALAQLGAIDAMPLLIGLLERIDEEDDESIQVELPLVFGLLGPAAAPALADYVIDETNGIWARLAAAEGLVIIALEHPETAEDTRRLLVRLLERHASRKPVTNALLIRYLARLGAVEAAPLIEQVFQNGNVDEEIGGDWEEFQVQVGLLQERATIPPKSILAASDFQDGVVEFSPPVTRPEPRLRPHKEVKKMMKRSKVDENPSAEPARTHKKSPKKKKKS